ncbi:MAG TPA: glycosyltransferase [Candidatus Paceibacterota bacterium]
MPKVSIILPCHNGAKYLPRAIKSVRAQTLTDWELIVVDDGSNDATSPIVMELARSDGRIKLMRNEKNLGIQKSLNRGLVAAKGEYVARIDDDDEWIDKDKLKKQADFLDQNPDCGLIGTGVVEVDENDKELFRYRQPATDAEVRKKILKQNCFTHSSVMFRRQPVIELGGYPETEETKHVEDYDLWLRLGEKWKFANLPDYATKFTLRPGNISSSNKTEQFRKDIALTKKYIGLYRGGLWAVGRGYLRVWAHHVLALLPKSVMRLVLRLYKST